MTRAGWVIGIGLAVAAIAGCGGGASAVKPSTSGPGATPGGGEATATEEIDPGPALQETISLEVEEVPLTQVAAQIGRGRGIQIVYDNRVDKKALEIPITLRLRGTSAASALYWVTREAGLDYYVDKSRVVLASPERIGAAQQEKTKRFRAAMERRWRPAMEKELQARKITCDVQDVTLAEVLGLLCDRYGVNTVAPWDMMKTKVSVKVEDRPIGEVLDALAKATESKWTIEEEAAHFVRGN